VFAAPIVAQEVCEERDDLLAQDLAEDPDLANVPEKRARPGPDDESRCQRWRLTRVRHRTTALLPSDSMRTLDVG